MRPIRYLLYKLEKLIHSFKYYFRLILFKKEEQKCPSRFWIRELIILFIMLFLIFKVNTIFIVFLGIVYIFEIWYEEDIATGDFQSWCKNRTYNKYQKPPMPPKDI